MSNIGNKYKIGMLVIAGSAIMIAGLLALGAFKYFHTTYDFCTVANSSVQGLDKGAKVKFRGVSLGEVKKIQIMDNLSSIMVIMKFDPDAFARSYGKKVNLKNTDMRDKFLEVLKNEIKKGLRCKLQYASITGNLYIELDYVDPAANPPMKVDLPADAPEYVPSVETATIAAVIAESQKTMANIGRIDFARLADKAERFLDTANGLFGDQRIGKTLDQTVEITANLKDLSNTLKTEVNQENIKKFANDIQSTLDNLNQALNDIRSSMKDAKVPETSSKARDLMTSADLLVKRGEALRAELAESVVKLNATLDSARLFFDLLERHPDAVIRGKGSTPVVESHSGEGAR